MNNQIEQTKALYQIVPAVYRTRDTGDLKQYFKACGLLSDYRMIVFYHYT